MAKGTSKEDGVIIDLLSKQPVIKQKLYSFRRSTGMFITPLAKALATAAAEDANTAYYVKEYNSGNFSSREDYIEYMADKFQFMMNGGKL